MTSTTPAARRHGWGTLALLTSAMGAGPLYNFALASASSLILERFGITTAQFGAILTVIMGSAALVSFGLGWLADRISFRTQFVILFGGAAIALVAAGLAPSYGLLLATSVFSGVSQAMSNPTTNRAIRALAPPARRGDWIGVKQSGVQAAQLAAGVCVPPLALVLGWTGATLIVAAASLVMLAATFVVIPRDSRRPVAQAPAVPRPAVAEVGGRVGLSPRGRWLALAILTGISFAAGAGMMATNAYLALYGVQVFGMHVVTGGLLVALAGLIGVASRVWWGRRMAAGATPARLLAIMAVGAMLAALSLLAAGLLGAQPLVWFGVLLHGVSVLGANVIVNATIISRSEQRVGLATGVSATGLYAGFASGPVIAGALIEAGGFAAAWIAVGAGYAVCLLLALAFGRLDRWRRQRVDA